MTGESYNAQFAQLQKHRDRRIVFIYSVGWKSKFRQQVLTHETGIYEKQ